MKVLILAGGKGTRAYPYTESMPKAMMPVNGRPILLHVMQLFVDQGFHEFVLSLGWHKDVIVDYFHRKHLDWDVTIADTGAETDTGGRIEKCRHLLGDTFMATYVDGLSDVSLDRLLDFHRSHDGLATITTVPLRSQYGTIITDAGDRITDFQEKPILREHWINAGFFVFDQEVFEHWVGTNLERHVFPHLAEKELVYAYKHDGFFKSMDTYKDQLEFEQLFQNGDNPWRSRRHADLAASP